MSFGSRDMSAFSRLQDPTPPTASRTITNQHKEHQSENTGHSLHRTLEARYLAFQVREFENEGIYK